MLTIGFQETICVFWVFMGDVTISEVRLKTLMKQIFKEKFEK